MFYVIMNMIWNWRNLWIINNHSENYLRLEIKRIRKLIKIIKDSLNTLIKDLANTTWIFTKEGVEDFTYICKALKENKEMHIKRLKGGKNNE